MRPVADSEWGAKTPEIQAAAFGSIFFIRSAIFSGQGGMPPLALLDPLLAPSLYFMFFAPKEKNWIRYYWIYSV